MYACVICSVFPSAGLSADVPGEFTMEVICVISRAGGQQGSVGIIRVSGMEAFDMLHKVFRRYGEKPAVAWKPKSHTVYYGEAIDPGGTVLDEVYKYVFVVLVMIIGTQC